MTPFQKDFANQLETVSRNEGMTLYQAFTSFLDMSYSAIKTTTLLKASDEAKALEDEYMKIVEGFSHDDTPSTMAKCLSLMTEALEEDLHDFLGPVYMEVMADKHMGQFFTPDAVSRLMAEITVDGLVSAIKENGYATASEPAGGTGGMVISLTNALKRRDVNFSSDVVWEVIELSQPTYRACYIQLSLCGVNACVIHGNTLSREIFDSANTPVRMLHPRKL